ncbi:hypothetical protein TVAG_527390 [Trichomonas vaginalis G3]|nr:hypothetical protein TVAGG3_0286710 [Trichomonas vaginalis G3]EAX85551.1 hypothetical protein TVAG_527390 [Trichomonas vaginalis G3]KAI5526954.1 hypothetical protein TVAGG3_0286710 [Trichomonas vaginalis G3]|eukprot:XP_001298481.1 hypothetical protein [Trichomonas vaginalis G3]
MIDNNEKELIPTLNKNQTHVLVEPGKHLAVLLHPWCDFHKVEFEVNENGLVQASSDGVTYKKYPIPIRHPKLASASDPLTKAQDFSNFMYLIIPAFIILKKFICPKNLGEKMKAFAEKQKAEMERLQKEQAQLQQQAKNKKNN